MITRKISRDENKLHIKKDRNERLEKIRSLTNDQSEDAAKILKMWLNRAAEKNK